MEKNLKILGYVSLFFGIAAALLCITPVPFGVFYAMVAGFLGLIFSSIYIFIDTRNEINTKKITPGVIAMMLSSIPVIFMIVIIVLSKINS